MGARDACLLEDVGVGRVADDVKQFPIARLLLEFLDVLVERVDGDERSSGALQLLDTVAASVAESADDEVIFQFANRASHAASPEDVTDFAFDEKSCHRGEDIHSERDAEEDDEDVEYAERGIVRGVDDLAIADAGESDYGHVERLQN